MTIDYDIVIIGGSLAGRYAALSATKLKAKVALVETKINDAVLLVNSPYGMIYHHAFTQTGNLYQMLGNTSQFGINTSHPQTQDQCLVCVNWQQAMLYADGVVSNLQEQDSLAILSAQGVDVIVGSGQFQSSPNLAFIIGDRHLRARAYLLATGSVPAIPDIEGLQKTGFLTLPQIWQSLSSPNPPKKWVILGGVPQSIEVAQTLAKLGCSVILVVYRPQILSHYLDSEILQLLYSQLEADGVRVIQTPVTQVMRIDEQKWLQIGDKAIETDEILVAFAQQPNIEFLNLAAAGVKWYQNRLLVNDKLQTTNHRIYACGDVIGGYDCPNIANHEARIALQNSLFFPINKVSYQCIPWAIFTNPIVAQVGLTEAQAISQYNQNEVVVLRQYFKTLAVAQLQDQTTGICKLIVLNNGEILGASILGAEADELINLVALAIAQKIKVHHLASLSPIYPSFSEILAQTALQWSQQRLNRNIATQEFLESFFLFRRNWNF
ncbi:FAD-dependent oxidoreductase [Iningainema tapete]|uniref:NAD(P)/FAD-dependent oxidoreductase n=1 Tax=Iningainema tapete BLCC-T55 TaxID=2748662 RepID=A0A8J6XVU6_9CYAN|nr:NAD(P)/FAD-dependent oxidoreductase [Iningainema tapete BLCC-T55]